MLDVLAAEWLKLRTIRSTWYIVAAVVGFAALITLVTWNAARVYDSAPPDRRADASMSDMPGVVGWGAALCFAIGGILSVASEHRTGLIRTTFAVVPARRTVLAAKALALAGLAYLVGQGAVLVTYLLVRWAIGGRAFDGAPGTFGEEYRLLLANGLAVVMFALLGLGLGAITRSVVGSVAALLVLWYFAPMVAVNLPRPWHARVGSVLPDRLAGQLAGRADLGYPDSPSLLAPLAAFAVMVAYVAVPLCVAAFLTSRRDTR